MTTSTHRFGWRRLFLGLAMVFLLASAASGDGCYMPERAIQKMPEIAAQRALLAWRDGVETLVISSALDSPSQRLGWIVPVPAVPTTIEKVSPGSLKTLGFCMQPRITHDLWMEMVGTAFLVVIANLLVGMWLFSRENFLGCLVTILCLLIFAALLVPAAGFVGEQVHRNSNLLVEKSVQVGSYGVHVIRASQAADLNKWLGENEFAALPPAADKIIADYIARGWVFTAIRLTREEAGANAPHPVKLVFPASEPVYPMKLTALAGGSPDFEIFVLADRRAACDQLPVTFCDRFTKENWNRWSHFGSYNELDDNTTYIGQKSGCEIAHPIVCEWMWDDCVLTKLCGTIAADEMTWDIDFRWEPFEPYRQHYYTKKGAGYVAAFVFLGLLTGLNITTLIFLRKKHPQSQPPQKIFVLGLAAAIGLIILVSSLVSLLLPTIDTSKIQLYRFPHERDILMRLWNDFPEMIGSHPEILRGTERQIGDDLANAFHAVAEERKRQGRVPSGKTEPQVEDSPGNFTVEKQADKILIRVYAPNGQPATHKFPIPDDTQPASDAAPAEQDGIPEL